MRLWANMKKCSFQASNTNASLRFSVPPELAKLEIAWCHPSKNVTVNFNLQPLRWTHDRPNTHVSASFVAEESTRPSIKAKVPDGANTNSTLIHWRRVQTTVERVLPLHFAALTTNEICGVPASITLEKRTLHPTQLHSTLVITSVSFPIVAHSQEDSS